VFCRHCGANLAPGAYFCAACGKDQTGSPVASAPAPSAPIIAGAGPPAGFVPTSGKAIGSLICGLFFFMFPVAIVAIVLGHLALSEIKRSAGRMKGEGLAIGGLVLGYLGIVFIPIILIIAAIAIPNLLRARMAANETSAIATIRTINLAEMTYSSTHSDTGFTCSLSDLHQAGLISDSIAAGHRNGYDLLLENCDAEKPGGPGVKYQVAVWPQKYNQTGRRAFCSDETNVVRVNPAGSPEDCLERGEPLQ